jgi:beta-lactamase class A
MSNTTYRFSYNQSPHRIKRQSKRKFLKILLLLAVFATGLWFYQRNQTDETTKQSTIESPQTASSPQAEVVTEQPQPFFHAPNLQSEVEEWMAQQTGQFAVKVVDLGPTSPTLVDYQSDEQFFTASIYKLYVVYLGYQDVEKGQASFSDQVSGSRSRKTCLDEAIRSSDSPCGEALLNEIGGVNVNKRLSEIGLSKTNFPGFVTSVNDASIILKKLYDVSGISKDNVDLFLDSMKVQPDKFRLGVPAAITDAIVANKVGYSETPHYHDTAIVYLPDGRAYSMAIFTKGVSVAKVKELASLIHQELK